MMGIVASGFHPMKKWPHARLCALFSDRYDAFECIFKIMSEAWKQTVASGLVARQLRSCLHFCIICSDSAEGHEDGKVDGTGIIKDAADNLLDMLNFFLAKRNLTARHCFNTIVPT